MFIPWYKSNWQSVNDNSIMEGIQIILLNDGLSIKSFSIWYSQWNLCLGSTVVNSTVACAQTFMLKKYWFCQNKWAYNVNSSGHYGDIKRIWYFHLVRTFMCHHLRLSYLNFNGYLFIYLFTYWFGKANISFKFRHGLIDFPFHTTHD